MSLWTLLQGALLIMNGLAVLNNERFLEKYGWGFSQMGNNPMGPSPNALKYQIIGLLHAAAYMRVPLIVLNTLVVFVKLVFG
ncbi:immediate early response 3-interacting 1-like [Micractinium conductrix]|uniref:Immediate early response 3-interacting 1-like n=1 Tax=Micractinium conductrix TaxID=554055 RepID=A0A2P6UYX9_9CHLO|nr:immediate early response 3-interacting 1-like [Micractinium conductrix]PSC67179.1 immediate early response 3-interacting 1-like [Micractinium conductrix]PSC67660.1 immediate early response 3-interacting 1-like [Micractinium conductrix]|eukprot:PSC67047.1 immediate early response 3-interacting 1-like [Micractinium conductrix]